MSTTLMFYVINFMFINTYICCVFPWSWYQSFKWWHRIRNKVSAWLWKINERDFIWEFLLKDNLWRIWNDNNSKVCSTSFRSLFLRNNYLNLDILHEIHAIKYTNLKCYQDPVVYLFSKQETIFFLFVHDLNSQLFIHKYQNYSVEQKKKKKKN